MEDGNSRSIHERFRRECTIDASEDGFGGALEAAGMIGAFLGSPQNLTVKKNEYKPSKNQTVGPVQGDMGSFTDSESTLMRVE